MSDLPPLLYPGPRAALLRRVRALTPAELHALDAAVRELRRRQGPPARRQGVLLRLVGRAPAPRGGGERAQRPVRRPARGARRRPDRPRRRARRGPVRPEAAWPRRDHEPLPPAAPEGPAPGRRDRPRRGRPGPLGPAPCASWRRGTWPAPWRSATTSRRRRSTGSRRPGGERSASRRPDARGQPAAGRRRCRPGAGRSAAGVGAPAVRYSRSPIPALLAPRRRPA